MYSSDSEVEGGISTNVIHDKPVVCRAVGSLPTEFLSLKHRSSRSKRRGPGVFARKEIPVKTVFGPLEGFMVNDDGNRNPKTIHYLVEVSGYFMRLETSNEFLSNWMKYVRPAKSLEEQNLCLHQKGKNLYFTTVRWVNPKEELRVWYSARYALSRNVGPIYSQPKGQPKELPQWDIDCTTIDGEYPPLLNDLNLWSCSHCLMKFDNATLLNFHMLTHAADNIETNELADLTNEAVSFTVIDISSTHLGEPFVERSESSPPIEVEVPPDKGDVKGDVEQKAVQKSFECPMCKAFFVKLADLKKHVRAHAKDGVYPCSTCSKTFRSYKHIRNHIRIYHRERRFQCEECLKRFPTKDKLKHHKLSHTGHKPYLCSECGKQFRRRDKLLYHVKRFHEEGDGPSRIRNPCQKRKQQKPTPNPKKEDDVDSENEISIRRTTSTPFLKVTPSESSKDFPYKCDICNVNIKRRGMMVNHLANAHPEVNLESVPELRLPLFKTDKDYFCQYCERVYKSASKRKSHILKTHPGKEVPPNERELKSPKKTAESGNQPSGLFQECGRYATVAHSCEWCYKQYASRAKLLQHQRLKHRELMPKSLQEPKKVSQSKDEEGENELLGRKELFQNDETPKVDENCTLLLQNPLEENLSEYEFHLGESKLSGDGEFIIDAPTLRRVLKGDVLAGECSQETLVELGQILETRPDQYFRILQTSNGISFARPVEVWDPCEPLSPEAPDSHHLLA